MDHETLKAALMQGSEDEAATLFNRILRTVVRGALLDSMAEEVTALCGAKHHPAIDSEHRRAGSESGVAYLGGEKEPITRPRVRSDEGEVQLATYAAASTQRNLYDQVISGIVAGGSIRGVSREKGSAIGKSGVSKMWIEHGKKGVEKLRSRDLSKTTWVAMMIDGVFPANETCVVIGIGIDSEGNKHVLDFERGTSESSQCVGDLLRRLVKRGFDPREEDGLLVCRDGSQAISKAVIRRWPWAIQQECLVHCERNVTDKLKRADRAEAKRLFARLRGVEGKEAGEEAFKDLITFVEERNVAAAEALREREDYLLAFHRLEVPAPLNKTFLSTNCIENVILNWRKATKGVKRWRESGDMIDRWTAFGLLHAEEGFRRISGYEHLGALIEALRGSGSSGGSSGSGQAPSPPSPPELPEHSPLPTESNQP